MYIARALEPKPRRASYLLVRAAVRWIDHEGAQGSGSGKALGIGLGELFASACSANAPLER